MAKLLLYDSRLRESQARTLPRRVGVGDLAGLPCSDYLLIYNWWRGPLGASKAQANAAIVDLAKKQTSFGLSDFWTCAATDSNFVDFLEKQGVKIDASAKFIRTVADTVADPLGIFGEIMKGNGLKLALIAGGGLAIYVAGPLILRSIPALAAKAAKAARSGTDRARGALNKVPGETATKAVAVLMFLAISGAVVYKGYKKANSAGFSSDNPIYTKAGVIKLPPQIHRKITIDLIKGDLKTGNDKEAADRLLARLKARVPTKTYGRNLMKQYAIVHGGSLQIEIVKGLTVKAGSWLNPKPDTERVVFFNKWWLALRN